MKESAKLLYAILVVVVVVALVFLWQSFRELTPAEKLAEIIHQEDRREINGKLEHYLTDTTAYIRQRAALAIGRIGAEKSSELLLPLLSDSSFDVATAAAFGIGLTGQKEYADVLLDIANDLSFIVAAETIEAAGRLADSSMTSVIEIISENFLFHPSPAIREASCYALFRANAKSKANDVMTLLEGEPIPSVQLAALYMLARLGIENASEIYIDFLADPDPFTRSLALRGLSRTDHPETEHYLSIALNDDDDRVVAQAIAGLSRLATESSASRMFDHFKHEEDEKLRVALIDGFRACESDIAVDEIRFVLEDTESPNIIGASLKYMAKVQKGLAVDMIDSVINNSNDHRVRSDCLLAYDLVSDSSLSKRIGIYFNDSIPSVRATALPILCRLDTSMFDFYIKRALNDNNYIVKSLAIDQIGRNKKREYLPTLKTIMTLEKDVETDVRRSIVSCANEFLKDNITDSLAMELLIDGILDLDYVVRKDASEAYEELGLEKRSNRVTPVRTKKKKGSIESAVKKYGLNPVAEIHTNKGVFEFVLLFDVAPLTVLNFIDLAVDGFYDNLTFHRVIPNFVAQGGDPEGTGWGGPGYAIRCEYSDEPYDRGTVGIATSGKDTGGSQFFITLSPQPHLDARYTVFGRVIAGMDAVDRIVISDRIEKIEIKEGQI